MMRDDIVESGCVFGEDLLCDAVGGLKDSSDKTIQDILILNF